MTVTFTGLASVADRTIYTHKGPIVKRPLELLTGANLTVTSETEVTIPTGPFIQTHVGKKIRISGSPDSRNDGTFSIARVVSSTKAILSGCSFNVVDEDATVEQLVVVANELKARYNRHILQPGVHYVDDVTNAISTPVAFNLDSVISLLNDVREKFSDHVVLIGSGPVHALADAEAVPSAPEAQDLNSAVILANQLMRLYRYHRENAVVHQDRDLTNRVSLEDVVAVRGSGALTGPFTWTLLDPRIGQIADDPSDVDVTVNGSDAEVEAVFGLLGAVVLKDKPVSGDTVLVDYDYLPNPPTSIQRLNSPEFNLNQVGNRGLSGYPGHKYRARAYLAKPTNGSTVVKSPVSPKQVGWKYKAFQRVYSAVLNDPNTLLLNVPVNRLFNPVLDTNAKEATLKYDPATLPEVSTDPWLLKGIGTITLSPGGTQLNISDTRTSSGADSEPPFYSHSIDLSFPGAVFSAFRVAASSSQTEGVFAGTAFGISDGQKVAIAGCLLTEATNLSSAIVMANDIRVKYSAHLVRTGVHRPNDLSASILLSPARDLASLLVLLAHMKSVYNSHLANSSVHQVADSANAISTADPTKLSEAIAFVNEMKAKFDAHRTESGIHFVNDSTNSIDRVRQVGLLKGDVFSLQSNWECQAVDWSRMTTYRLHRDIDGRTRLFVGGEVLPIANLAHSLLPSTANVDARFDQLQQVFFGALGQSSKSESHWAFLRVNVIPAQERQIGDNKSVTFTPVGSPELDTVSPWIPVGQAGYERITASKLLVDSTASAHVDDINQLGLATGAYRGFVRYEPSLTRTATCAFEFSGSVAYNTFSVDNKAAGVFLDDGSLSTHLLYIEASPTPASTTSTQDEPFPISSGDTLIIASGTAQPVTTTFGSALSSATAIAAAITATTGMPVASNDLGRIKLTDSVSGAASKIQIIGGTAVEKLGLRVGTYFGKDSNTGPRISWFGAYLPDEENPAWTASGNQPAEMHGRSLHIDDSSTIDYRVYTFSDPLYTKNTLESDWKLDIRLAVESYVAGDPVAVGSNLKFCGALCNVDEGPTGKNVEVHFSVDSLGSPYLNILSYSSGTGSLVSVAEFPFSWNDTKAHSVNVFATKSSDVCLVIADGVALGTFQYSSLQAGSVGPSITFGSGAQPAVNADLRTSTSIVDWKSVALFVSANPASVAASRRYMGLYKGGDPALLSSYYLHQIDWSTHHTYRIVRDPQGAVNVYVDGGPTPVISANYDSLSLPPSEASFLSAVTGMKNVVAFGSFNPFELSRTSWGSIRYSIGELSLSDRRVVGNQVNNQGHVIASSEHLRSGTSHTHSNTKVYSSGTPTDDFLASTDLVASTLLGERTPPVVQTQDLTSRGGLYRVATLVSSPDAATLVNTRGFLTDLEDDTTNVLSVVPDSTAPYDLPTCIAVVNELKSQFNKHLSQYRVHVTRDTNNVVTTATATNLSTACALANALKSAFNDHLSAKVGDGNVHTTNDAANVVASTDATDLDTLGLLCIEMSDNYTAHLSESGVHGSSVFIRLDAPSRVLYDRMKFFKEESGDSGLVSPFSDDETLYMDGLRSTRASKIAFSGNKLPEYPNVMSSVQPFSVAGGEELVITVDGTPTTITLEAGDTNAALVAARINLTLSGLASANGDGRFRLTGSTVGGSITVSGDAAPLLGLDVAQYSAWSLLSNVGSSVSATIVSDALRYETISSGTATVYRSKTGLPDLHGGDIDLTFRVRISSTTLDSDGDTGVYFGMSGSVGKGFTAAIGFDQIDGLNYVKLKDMASGEVLYRHPFNWDDGAFHRYKLSRNARENTLSLTIVS